MLTSYLTSTRRLLQFPSSSNSLYATVDLTDYINTARGQLAGEAECIRFRATLSLVAGQRIYPFSTINLTGATGIQGVLNVRQSSRVLAGGEKWMRPRGFEWFTLYKLNNPIYTPGPPVVWSQYAQGVNGSIYVDPIPDVNYTAALDTVCYPIDLVDDNTAEAIPKLWQDAVPFFAAYYALLTAQSAARQADADRMMNRYGEFVARARRAATPSVLPTIYSQVPSPVRQNQLGQQPPAGGG